MPKHRLSHPRGFTLIELLVVASIAAVIGGFALSAFTNFNRRQILEQSAAQIISDLRLAQTRAAAGYEGKVWGVSFAKSAAEYTAFKVIDPSRSGCSRGCTTNSIVSKTIPFKGDVTLVDVDIRNGDASDDGELAQVVFGALPGTFRVNYYASVDDTDPEEIPGDKFQLTLMVGDDERSVLVNEVGNVYFRDERTGGFNWVGNIFDYVDTAP